MNEANSPHPNWKKSLMIVMAATYPFYKKSIFLILIIIFPLGLLAIALDQHLAGYSSTCPICQAKYSFNGIGSSFALELYFAIVGFILSEQPINPTIPFFSLFLNKSPPEYF